MVRLTSRGYVSSTLRRIRFWPFERKNKAWAIEKSFGIVSTLKTPPPFIKHSLLYFLV
jgi:hypothetical protein